MKTEINTFNYDDPDQEMESNHEFSPDSIDIISESGSYKDESRMEEVLDHQFYHKDWSEEIPKDDMELPPVGEAIYPSTESICGRDDRKRISSTHLSPWRFICKLYITASDGKKYVGSGFFIGKRCIITSGHVVHHGSRGWAKSITVVPGQNQRSAPFGVQASGRFSSVKGWTRSQKADYDYGAIFLPDDTLYSRLRGYFGFKILNSSQILNNSGYPADKPSGTQWYNAGPITGLSNRRFFYMIDTYGGQSGSPVWINDGSGRVAVGVHGYGGCPNSAVRCIPDVARNWSQWKSL